VNWKEKIAERKGRGISESKYICFSLVHHRHHHQEVIEEVMREIKVIIVHHVEVEVVVIRKKFRLKIKNDDDHDQGIKKVFIK
jgi:hypothetical protein